MRDLSNKMAKTRNEVEYAFLEGGAADEGVGEGVGADGIDGRGDEIGA